MCGVSTFCEYTTVSTASAVRIDPSIPLELACLTGCGVGTGWGAAVNSADVRPGQVVIVMGIADIAEATELARSMTNGQGADAAIVTVGVTRGRHVGQAVRAVRKGGVCVMVGLGDVRSGDGDIPLMEMVLYQKRLVGSLFGASAPSADIPAQLELWRQGSLKLEELITTRYPLDRVAEGFDDMHAGRNLRGVIVY